MHLKPEIRIVGVDDSPLLSEQVLVVGAVMRGGDWLDGVVRTDITRDGMDATERIACMIGDSKYAGEIRVIMLNGVTFGGFNVVDTALLSDMTGIPVISVMRRKPDLDSIYRALQNLSEPEHRYDLINRAGKIVEVQTQDRGAPIYIQYKNLSEAEAVKIVVGCSIHSRIPEPLRVAHLIATGIVLGESSKRA